MHDFYATMPAEAPTRSQRPSGASKQELPSTPLRQPIRGHTLRTGRVEPHSNGKA